jgi:polyphosphate kinase
MSWLEFNERVLDQARDAAHPLLDRVKFLAITASNLDEFFMIRVANTLKKLNAGTDKVAPDGHNTEQQLAAMQARARRMLRDQLDVWSDLRTALDPRSRVLDRSGVDRRHRAHLSACSRAKSRRC